MPMIPSLVQVFPTRIRGAIMVVDCSLEPARSRPGETCPDEDLVSQLLADFRLCLELC